MQSRGFWEPRLATLRLNAMKTLAILLALSLFATSCGSEGATDVTVNSTAPGGQEDGVLIEISNEGGFMPVEMSILQVPGFTVFADGSVVTLAGDQNGFPGPALPSLVRYQLDETAFQDIVAFTDDLGIADIDVLDINDAPNVADAGTTVLRYWDDAGEHRISIYALGIDGSDGRGAIIQSMMSVLDRARTSADVAPFVPERLVVFAQVADGFDRAAVTNGGTWPLTITPDEMNAEVAAFSCTTLTGDDVAAAVEALAGTTSMTLWDLDGVEYQILARPLLPQQEGC